MTADISRLCDGCNEEMITRDGVTGWMVPTGRHDAEFDVPVVEIFCVTCYHQRERE